MRMITFEGITLNPKKVIGCSDIKTYSTGPLSCDWEYGFDIYCEGNTIPFHQDIQGYGFSAGPSREDYIAMIKSKRDKFLNLVASNDKSTSKIKEK